MAVANARPQGAAGLQRQSQLIAVGLQAGAQQKSALAGARALFLIKPVRSSRFDADRLVLRTGTLLWHDRVQHNGPFRCAARGLSLPRAVNARHDLAIAKRRLRRLHPTVRIAAVRGRNIESRIASLG